MHQNKDQEIKKKIEKGAKSWISKPKRVKISTKCLNGESKSHIDWKIYFTTIKTKTLTGHGKKVDFLIQSLDRVEFWTVS